MILEQIPLPDDADKDVCHYRLPGLSRLILETVHGQIIIDVRTYDVNAFSWVSGRRVDRTIIERKFAAHSGESK